MSYIISFRNHCELAIVSARNHDENKTEEHLLVAKKQMELASIDYKSRSELSAVTELQNAFRKTIDRCKISLLNIQYQKHNKHNIKSMRY